MSCSNKHEAKRQRRGADPGSAGTRAATTQTKSAALEDSDDEPGMLTVSKVKKARAEAAQSARQVEVFEKEKEREKTRQEAAGRRQDRAGRRRVDEDPSDETPNPNGSAKTSPPPSSQPGSPPPNDALEKVSHKKGAGKRVKKLGNNQYTKFRDSSNQPAAPSPQGKKRQAGHHQSASSGDEPLLNGNSHAGSNSNGTNKNSPERMNGVKAKFAKGKGKGANANGGKHAPEDPAEMTMARMKRNVDAMAAFIAKAQQELGGDRTPPGSDRARASGESAGLMGVAGGAVQPPDSQVSEGSATAKNEEDMSAAELGERVSGNLAKWQSLYGHLA